MSEGRMAGEERHPDGVGLAPDVPAGYRRTVVGVIPADWVVTRLCDCGEIVMGQSPPGISYNRSGAGSALINGPTEFTETHPVKVQWTTEPKRFCKPGDLLICVRGSSTGRTNYADDIYAIGRGVAAVRAKAANDTQYLSYQVILGVSNLLAAATGSTFPSVDGASLRKILILSPLPPEQRAIAAVLSDVDELIGSLEALIAKKRAIKQAAMQQLLTGRTRLPGFGGEWEMVELGAVLRIRDRKISPVEVGGDTPCVELEHIGQGDGRLASHGTAAKSSSIKYQFEPRDILFGRLRPYLRKWWYADRGGVCSTEIWPLVVDRKRAASGFVYTLVQTDRFLEAAETSYGTHMPRADWNIVSGVEFPFPPLSEQRAIATVLSEMDAEIAALERRLDKTRAIKQGMMQQLLTGSIRLPIPGDEMEDDHAHDA